MKILFYKNAWEDYLFFQQNNKDIFNKINLIIKDICRSPFNGLGKPELLKHSLTGYWSRRINQQHRLVYTIDNNILYILQCKYHYEK
jgi:toxin YoeB